MASLDDKSHPAGVAELADRAWTVARLNEEIDAVLRESGGRFPTYVVGEISEVSPYDFGTFFELRDLEGEAVISCLAWSDAVDEFDRDLEDGAAGIVRASVDFYAERGDTQLVVSDYWPVGDSVRAKELEALRSTLEAEGLLDDERKQTLPAFPDCIGVVTSLSGSAREDFTSTVLDRSAYATVKLCAATVQGDAAIPSLVGAIQTLERDASVDVIVVTRGGGSDTDLWCFNEEAVVRAIADCRTPVVTAVGHEDDETLADAVADRRAMTPTDAGVAATPNVDAVLDELGQLERTVDRAYADLVSDRLDAFDRRIETAVTSLERRVESIERTRQRGADLERRIESAYVTMVDDRLGGLERRLDAGLRAIQHAAETEAVEARAARIRVGDLEARITSAYATLVNERLGELERRLDASVQAVRHAAETEAVTMRAARGRVGGLEVRVDAAYETRVERELTALEARIETAYRDRQADARIAAGTAQARRLRIVVAVLAAVLVLGTALVLWLTV